MSGEKLVTDRPPCRIKAVPLALDSDSQAGASIQIPTFRRFLRRPLSRAAELSAHGCPLLDTGGIETAQGP